MCSSKSEVVHNLFAILENSPEGVRKLYRDHLKGCFTYFFAKKKKLKKWQFLLVFGYDKT